MGTKFPFFNFPVCKIYLGTLARRTRRTLGRVGHVEHMGTLGTPLRRLKFCISDWVITSILINKISKLKRVKSIYILNLKNV